MRIAVDARPLTHPTTGIGRYTRALLKRLAGSSHEFTLYSHAPVAAELSAGLRVRHGPAVHAGLSTLYAQAHFGRWARQDGVDLFWSPRHHLPPRLGRIPSVVTIHDLVWRAHPETMIRLGRLVEAVLMPRALRSAARIIAVSQSTAADIARYYPDAAAKVVVIPEASDLEPAPHDPAAGDQPYFLFIGTLEPRKNLERVLQAFDALRQRGVRSHRLVVAGNPGWKNATVARSLDGRDGVDWLGQVEDTKLASLYAAAYAVIVPSIYEGFAIQIVEAMGFGVPVITSNVSAMPEVAGDAGLLVDPTSVEDIASAVERLVNDRALRERLAARAASRADSFSWDRAATSTLSVLERAAHERG